MNPAPAQKDKKPPVKKKSDRTIFDDRKRIEEYNTGRSSENLLRMKHLAEISKLYAEAVPNLSMIYSQELFQVAEKQVIRM
jgi:hypothetical protein